MVGQSEKVLIPSRKLSLCRTFTPTKSAPRWARICTTWAEKPHWGCSGTPFMNSTTGCSSTVLAMNSWTGFAVVVSVISSPFRRKSSGQELGRGVRPVKARAAPRLGRCQRKRVQLPAHPALQRGVDQLVLAHPGQAHEGGGDAAGPVEVT